MNAFRIYSLLFTLFLLSCNAWSGTHETCDTEHYKDFVDDARDWEDVLGAVTMTSSAGVLNFREFGQANGNPTLLKPILDNLLENNSEYNPIDPPAKPNAVATIFVRNEHGDFIRATTSVTVNNEGGSAPPVVGTTLSKNSNADKATRVGASYCGKVKLFGKCFDSIYQPLFDSEGKIVGILYFGELVDCES